MTRFERGLEAHKAKCVLWTCPECGDSFESGNENVHHMFCFYCLVWMEWEPILEIEETTQ